MVEISRSQNPTSTSKWGWGGVGGYFVGAMWSNSFTNRRYVQLVAEHVMTKGIRDQVDEFSFPTSMLLSGEGFFGLQVDALKQGFHELIPSVRVHLLVGAKGGSRGRSQLYSLTTHKFRTLFRYSRLKN